MFSLTTLASGSAGNCALVQTDQCRLLIDSGLSARQISLRLAPLGLEPAQLDGILITHEHCDHISGLEVLCKRHQIPLYTNSLTAEALGSRGEKKRDWRLFQTGSAFTVGDLEVQTFAIPHDAVDPVGFVLNRAGVALGFATDLGFATKLVMERLRGVHTLVIETNHDEKLLREDKKRPWSVKQRIMSRHGHLSNEAAARILQELLHDGLQRVVLGHLSRDCNSPELATGIVSDALAQAGAAHIEVFCASQAESSPRFSLL
jgi:phosphoribosyl 1,2-cyclic phosphodiesterase